VCRGWGGNDDPLGTKPAQPTASTPATDSPAASPYDANSGQRDHTPGCEPRVASPPQSSPSITQSSPSTTAMSFVVFGLLTTLVRQAHRG
jgi:hypothetical protein